MIKKIFQTYSKKKVINLQSRKKCPKKGLFLEKCNGNSEPGFQYQGPIFIELSSSGPYLASISFLTPLIETRLVKSTITVIFSKMSKTPFFFSYFAHNFFCPFFAQNNGNLAFAPILARIANFCYQVSLSGPKYVISQNIFKNSKFKNFL